MSRQVSTMSSGGGVFDPRWFRPGWCHRHKMLCSELSPNEKWRKFCRAVKWEAPKRAYRLVPRFRSCQYRESPADFLIEQRALDCIKFIGERKRLHRQLLTTPNYLSRTLPYELLEPIARAMTRVLRPASLGSDWRPVVKHDKRALISALGLQKVLIRNARERKMKEVAWRLERRFRGQGF